MHHMPVISRKKLLFQKKFQLKLNLQSQRRFCWAFYVKYKRGTDGALVNSQFVITISKMNTFTID